MCRGLPFFLLYKSKKTPQPSSRAREEGYGLFLDFYKRKKGKPRHIKFPGLDPKSIDNLTELKPVFSSRHIPRFIGERGVPCHEIISADSYYELQDIAAAAQTNKPHAALNLSLQFSFLACVFSRAGVEWLAVDVNDNGRRVRTFDTPFKTRQPKLTLVQD